MIVGEVSGDQLGADLIRSLKNIHPNILIEGILGPASIKAGGHALYDMENLAVMGLIEPLKHLPKLLRIRAGIIQHFLTHPPDIFIGIDAPDFNLTVEKRLKKHNLTTVHYVSPSVWAWRHYRIKLIKKAVDMMLTLFPFELTFYEKESIPAVCTGHPLADQIPLEIDTQTAKIALGFNADSTILAIMPGSRHNELKYLGDTFILTAKACYAKNPSLQFIMPLIKKSHVERMLERWKVLAPEVPILITIKSKEAMACMDAALVTSGTATLELMLYKKPMIVAYKMHIVSYHIVKCLLRVPYIALPNLLANEPLVPEYIQHNAHESKLTDALLSLIAPTFDKKSLQSRFLEYHKILRKGAGEKAAETILQLINAKKHTQ